MGGARAGEVASSLAAGVFGDESESPRGARGAAHAHRAGGQQAHLRACRHRRVASRHGHHAHRRNVHGDQVSLGARRRQPRLPAARRRARAAHARPLAGRRARAHGPDHAGGRRAPPAALDHHARAGPGAEVDVDTYTVTGRDGDLFLICSDGLTSMVADDELAALLRSPDLARGRGGVAPAGGKPERRQGQHHGRAVPPGRRGRGRRPPPPADAGGRGTIPGTLERRRGARPLPPAATPSQTRPAAAPPADAPPKDRPPDIDRDQADSAPRPAPPRRRRIRAARGRAGWWWRSSCSARWLPVSMRSAGRSTSWPPTTAAS